MNTPVAVTREFGTRLCAAMGLDAGQVQTIDLHFEYGCVVSAKVGIVLNGEVISRVLELLEDGSWRSKS